MRHKIEPCQIRVALREESNAGWVWVGGPRLKDVKSRTIVKIKRPWHRGVYTDVRMIEDNFLAQYNPGCERKRTPIQPGEDTIVIGEWYRNAIGIKSGEEPSVVVKEVGGLKKILGFASLRAACHHPDPVVRLGTRLGILGAWLGLLALADPTLKVFYEAFGGSYNRLGSLAASLHMSSDIDHLRAMVTIGVALVARFIGLWLCRGRSRPLGK